MSAKKLVNLNKENGARGQIKYGAANNINNNNAILNNLKPATTKAINSIFSLINGHNASPIITTTIRPPSFVSRQNQKTLESLASYKLITVTPPRIWKQFTHSHALTLFNTLTHPPAPWIGGLLIKTVIYQAFA